MCFSFHSQGEDTPAVEVYTTQKLLVSFGGMDTTGQIFDDLFVIPVE